MTFTTVVTPTRMYTFAAVLIQSFPCSPPLVRPVHSFHLPVRRKIFFKELLITWICFVLVLRPVFTKLRTPIMENVTERPEFGPWKNFRRHNQKLKTFPINYFPDNIQVVLRFIIITAKTPPVYKRQQK